MGVSAILDICIGNLEYGGCSIQCVCVCVCKSDGKVFLEKMMYDIWFEC